MLSVGRSSIGCGIKSRPDWERASIFENFTTNCSVLAVSPCRWLRNVTFLHDANPMERLERLEHFKRTSSSSSSNCCSCSKSDIRNLMKSSIKKVTRRGLLLGAHMSIAGGVDKSLLLGKTVDCHAIQIFTKSSRQWAAKP